MLKYVRVYKSMIWYVRYVMVWYVRELEAKYKVWKSLLRHNIISKLGIMFEYVKVYQSM